MTAPPPAADVLLAVRELRVHFPVKSGLLRRTSAVIRAVDDISLDVLAGETLAVVGESGSGKTTLGRAILQLIRPIHGSVTYEGTDLTMLPRRKMRRFRRDLQIIFQDPYGSLDPRMKIGHIVEEPLVIHRIGRNRQQRIERVEELLTTVGLLPSMARRYPHEFSGGQRQRIGIARALAADPRFLVCDEAVSALDVSIQAQIVTLLESLKQQLGLTYLFIAHDLAVVRHISDRVAVMYLGEVVEIGRATDIFARSGHPYTRALLSAAPVPNPIEERRRQRVVLRGDIPSPARPPSGCRFHTRCWLYQELGTPRRCREDDPPFTEIGNAHLARCHFTDDVTRSAVGIASEAADAP